MKNTLQLIFATDEFGGADDLLVIMEEIQMNINEVLIIMLKKINVRMTVRPHDMTVRI